MRRNAFGQLVHPLIRMFADEVNGGGSDGDKGFTPPASQAELDKLINSAVGRTHQQYAGTKDKAEKWDAYEASRAAQSAANQTPEQRNDTRLTSAEERAQAAEKDVADLRRELMGERVQSALSTALTGRTVNANALFGFNQEVFVKDGAIDADAIGAWVQANSTESKPGQVKVPGQGDRDSNAMGGSVQSGRDLFDSQKKNSRKE